MLENNTGGTGRLKIFLAVFISYLVLTLIPSFSEQNRALRVTDDVLNTSYTVGKQYLVLIAINQYEKWSPLQHPVLDAKEVKNIITARYFVDEVIELYDREATKANIVRLFKDLQKRLTLDDSLFIFYAGHGHLDKEMNTGFLIPVDAGTDLDAQENWIANSQIRGMLDINNLKAMHVLLVADSCFSGDMLDTGRGMSPTINLEYFKKAYTRVSRQVLTSGASETVPDESEFATQFKLALLKNRSKYLDPLMIFNEIRIGISKTTPLLGSLSGTGHQREASFLFFLKEPNPQDPGNITAVPDQKQTSGKRDQQEIPAHNAFLLEAGSGIIFPVLDVSIEMKTGLNPVISFKYLIPLEQHTLGLGGFSGVQIASTLDTVEYRYDLYSLPVAVTASYWANILPWFFTRAEIKAGIVLNYVRFLESYPEFSDIFTVKPFLSAGLGTGLRLNKSLEISLSGNMIVIFFNSTFYTAISPIVSMGIIF